MQPEAAGANRHNVWRSVEAYASPTANPVGAKQMEKGRLRMSGFPRDLAVLDPWDASLERSRARRERAGRSGRRNASPRAHVAHAVGDPRRAQRSCATRATSPKSSRGSSRWGARARAGAPPSCGSCPRARGRSGSRSALSRRSPSDPPPAWPTGSAEQPGTPEPRTADDDRTHDRAQRGHRRQAGGTAPARARRHQRRRHLRPGNRSSRARSSRQAQGLTVDGDRRPADGRRAARPRDRRRRSRRASTRTRERIAP